MKHTARKRFGQNFLHDTTVIARIVGSIAPMPGHNVIEIGPGLGAMTFPVLSKCQKMRAIELDRDLIVHLEKEHQAYGELELISADALKVDFSTFGDQLRVIGNLPYNISSPLLFHLLDHRQHIKDMHFMLQKEVVNRMASPPGSKVYGRLSVMIQAYCNVEKLFDVLPGAFNPPPAVDSAIVRLTPKPASAPHPSNHKNFATIVTAAFAQRRKTLRNNLREHISVEQIESLGISPSDRSENLSVEQFIQLSALIN